MAEIHLTQDGQRVLRDAEAMCYKANIAIAAPEHLLAAALTIVRSQGVTGLPDEQALQQAALMVHGSSDQPLKEQVMWGSAAREAINATARTVGEAGETEITAKRLAVGLVDSGEVNPMFFMSAGTTKDAVRGLLTS